MKHKHNWVFDYHYINGSFNDYAENAIYHCTTCGKVKRVPVWTDVYEEDHD